MEGLATFNFRRFLDATSSPHVRRAYLKTGREGILNMNGIVSVFKPLPVGPDLKPSTADL